MADGTQRETGSGGEDRTLDYGRPAVRPLWVGRVLTWVVVVMLLFLVAAILMPSLGHSGPTTRGMCAANLRGIVQSMAVYSADNGDVFPVVPFAPFGPGNGGTSGAKGGADEDAALKSMYAPGSPVAGSPLAGPWILVMNGSVVSKQFICDADPFARSASPASLTDAEGNCFLQFQADRQISYSFAYPYREEGKVGGWWKNETDASVPVGSDMAPVSRTGSPKRVLSAPSAREGNSGNHGGVGQNVAFGDNHVDFDRNIAVGQGGDNIFTVSGRVGGSATGTAPTLAPINIDGTPGNYDTVMVPERNLDTGKLW